MMTDLIHISFPSLEIMMLQLTSNPSRGVHYIGQLGHLMETRPKRGLESQSLRPAHRRQDKPDN